MAITSPYFLFLLVRRSLWSATARYRFSKSPFPSQIQIWLIVGKHMCVGAESRAVQISWRMTNLALILWSLDTSNSLTKNQVGDLFSCLRSSLYECHHSTSPKGKHHEAQGWPRFVRPTLGRYEGVQSTLKGLREDATPSGLDLNESTTQGWPHKARPTLGSEMLLFQGSYEFRKSNLDELGLQPDPYVHKSQFHKRWLWHRHHLRFWQPSCSPSQCFTPF